MLAYLFVAIAVAVHLRFFALPFSFTPVAASLLYFGARMPRRQMWIPVALLAASDVYLTRVTYAYPLTADHLVTWAWYGAMVLLGGGLIKGFSAIRRRGVADRLGVVLPHQQLRRVGDLARYVRQDLQRPDGVLRRRTAVLPQHGCVRHAVHRGLLRNWLSSQPGARNQRLDRQIAEPSPISPFHRLVTRRPGGPGGRACPELATGRHLTAANPQLAGCFLPT